MNNVFLGRVTLQSGNSYDGHKYVFVKLKGQKNSYRPTNGGIIQNPFINGGKLFQADLCEYRIDGKVFVLKTFEVKEGSGTSIKIVKDAFRHKPEVGTVIMKAPTTLTGTGAAYAITAVDDSNDAYWTVTVATSLGTLAQGDILVEGAESGTASKMLVTNPNSMLDIDAVMKFPTANAAENVKYAIAPVMHEIAYVDRMAPLPACIKALNKSNVNGWFEI